MQTGVGIGQPRSALGAGLKAKSAMPLPQTPSSRRTTLVGCPPVATPLFMPGKWGGGKTVGRPA